MPLECDMRPNYKMEKGNYKMNYVGNKLRRRMKLLEFRRQMNKNKLIKEYNHTCFLVMKPAQNEKLITCIEVTNRHHHKLLSLLERFKQAESSFWFISLSLLLHQRRHQERLQNFI